MKTIREGFLRKNLGLGKEALIKKWLKDLDITDYTINDDLTIDVASYVDLIYYEEKQLPDYIQFGNVEGDFRIRKSNIISLWGCPKEVGGGFDCSECSELESLEGAPRKVGEWFVCSRCPKLKSLEGVPREVGDYFNCKECGKQFTKDDVKKLCKVKYRITV